MILGDSGSGKSTSLRNFEPNEIGIFNVASKPLPFRKKLLKVDGAGYGKIIKGLSSPKLNAYAIDDSQYLLAFEFFDRAKENGYNKFTDIALNFRNLIQFVITQTPPDCIVYFLHHTETTTDGTLKAKTIGKMLDERGCFRLFWSAARYDDLGFRSKSRYRFIYTKEVHFRKYNTGVESGV